MKKTIESSISELEQITSNTGKLLDKLMQASDKAEAKNSSALFGVAGGITGALTGILIAPQVGVAALLLSAPLTALGIISGVLTYRGRSGIKLEKMIDQNSLACDEILKRIRSLPEDTPQFVRDDLWENYRELNGAYRNQSAVALSPTEASTQGLLLPSNSDKTL